MFCVRRQCDVDGASYCDAESALKGYIWSNSPSLTRSLNPFSSVGVLPASLRLRLEAPIPPTLCRFLRGPPARSLYCTLQPPSAIAAPPPHRLQSLYSLRCH